eukprot:gene41067-39132_t
MARQHTDPQCAQAALDAIVRPTHSVRDVTAARDERGAAHPQ